MSESETMTDDLPAGTTVWHCPLCEWTYALLPAAEQALVSGSTDPADVVRRVYVQVEAALEPHARGHALSEWVAEVVRLQGELARAQAPMTGHDLWHEADAIVGRIRAAADAVDAECTERHRDMLGPLAKAHEEIIALARRYAETQVNVRTGG